MSYEDEIIQKYNNVLYGARVEITGRAFDGTQEKITFTTPPRTEERVKVKNPGNVHWKRVKVSPSLFLLKGIGQDGSITDTYLCRMGKPWQKIPITHKDLNYKQFLQLKRLLKEWERPVQEIIKN